MTDAARPAPAAGRRARPGVAALVALALGWALLMQSLGWAQTSYYASVKALGDGTTQIDAYHWETRDKSYIGEHFYSVKAPGLPLLLTPPHLAMEALGAERAATAAADTAWAGGARLWSYRGVRPESYGFDVARALEVKRTIEVQAPRIWALGLVGTVLPALVLLLLVRRRVERIEPGLGTLTAITLGTATLVMPFATQLFGHVLATLLAFAGFLVAWSERDGPRGRLAMVGAAGVLAGLAVTTEYPLAITGAIVGVYALLRPDVLTARTGRLAALARRAGAYTAGVALGVAPLLIYNLVAFGSVTTLSYENAVDEQGTTGHATLGLNDGGFFGIGLPQPRQALELLVSARGLLVLTPVLVLAAVGIRLMRRRGLRAEAWVITAVALSYFVYNAGYWLPMGGGSPGPRFLVPVLPFLAVALALAWRRYPGPTLALAVPSMVTMVAATVTMPLVGAGQTDWWMDRVLGGFFQHTVLSAFGWDNGWMAIAPVLLLVAAAAALAWRVAPALDVRAQARPAFAALGAWAFVAVVVAPLLGEELIAGRTLQPSGIVEQGGHSTLAAVGLAAAALVLLAAIRRSPEAEDEQPVGLADREPETGARAPRSERPWRPRQPVGVQHHRPDPETA